MDKALRMALGKARRKPQLVRDILATGAVEGLASRLNAKVAAVSYRAERYRRTWVSLIGWQDLELSTAAAWADSMIETIETNVHMTETDSWPTSSSRRRRRSKH